MIKDKTTEKFFQRCYDDFGFFYIDFIWPMLVSDKYIEAPFASDLLIEYAQAFDAEQIRKLLIAIPPRNGKTTLLTIALPLWSWLRQPSLDWATISASDAIIDDFYSKRNTIFKSDLYRAMWVYFHGERILDFTKDSTKFVKNGIGSGGNFYQWTMMNTRTGIGAHRIIVDDPTPTKHASSRNYNHKVEEEFRKSTLSRRHNKAVGFESPIMVVQQRVCTGDLIGCMSVDSSWTYLELQAIAEERTIFTFPISGKEWTREPGAILNPERESFETLMTLKSESVPGGFQAQYQQRPANSENSVVSEDALVLYSAPRSEYNKILLSIDCAATTETYSSNWGFTVWGVTADKKMDLLFCHAKKYEYPLGKKKALELIEQWVPGETIIENKSTGMALIPELKDKGHNVSSFLPSKAAKADRIIEMIPTIVAQCRFPNLIKIPSAVWFGLFSYELLSFPNSATDDLLDSCVMAVRRIHPLGKKATPLKRFYGVN